MSRFQSRIRKPRHAVSGYSPLQVAAAYQFPNFTGKGCTIGVIELGGAYVASDMAAFCQLNNVSVPSVTAVPVMGGGAVSDPGGADVEVALDVQVIAGVANGARQRVYFAPNTDQGFAGAITQALQDGCNALSISWGGPEDQWSSQSRQLMEQATSACMQAGVPVFAAAGDNGSSDGERGDHVDLPACLPAVVGCGGTMAVIVNNAVQSESVWNDGSQGGATGGGVSVYEPIPSYQQGVGVPGGRGRGVPDLAGNADSATGYRIVSGGQLQVVGGTSAVAPLMAALYALLWEATGGKVGPAWPAALYSLPKGCFRDIVTGNNGTYSAKASWDACTGIGVPVGSAILAAIGGTTPPPVNPPVPPSPPVSGPTANGVQSAVDQDFASFAQTHPFMELFGLKQLKAQVDQTIQAQWS